MRSMWLHRVLASRDIVEKKNQSELQMLVSNLM